MSDPANEVWKIAPTLDQLRKLPSEQKDRLFLAKLEKMSRHDSNVLNKHNLMLPGDPYALAYGYPEVEKQAVKEHLLGAPWTRLVNEGHLVDFHGQGFYKVSAEGHDYLKREQETSAGSMHATASGFLPDPIKGVPRAFLSYSWDGPEHKEWVRSFAERLQKQGGIQILFDRWHLKPGQDKTYFMEQAVAKSEFVIVICTENYAERANNREGGVGYESIVITSEVAEHMLTDKFIPVLRRGSFKTAVPTYLKSRLGVNLSGDPYSEEEYDDLLRKVHSEPIQGPPIGSRPTFSKPPSNLEEVTKVTKQINSFEKNNEPSPKHHGRTIAEEIYLLCANPENGKTTESLERECIPLAIIAELIFLKRVKLVACPPSKDKLFLKLLNRSLVNDPLLDRVLRLISARTPGSEAFDLPKDLTLFADVDQFLAYLQSRGVIGDIKNGFFSSKRSFLANKQQLAVRNSFVTAATSRRLSERMAIVAVLATRDSDVPVGLRNATWREAWIEAKRISLAQSELARQLIAVLIERNNRPTAPDGYMNVN